jgi:threonine efflux protein
MWRNRTHLPPSTIQSASDIPNQSSYQALYSKAFFTNLFNPKSILYFSSIFTATKATQLPIMWKWVVILGLPLTGFLWYSFLVLVVNHPWLAPYYRRYAHWISRLAAILLLGLALQLLHQAWGLAH